MYPLHVAAAQGNVPQVRNLIRAGYPINEQDDQALATPLHYAAINGHGDVIRALLELGADQTIVDDEGKTAYDKAGEVIADEDLQQIFDSF